jgi:hypothetical protein
MAHNGSADCAARQGFPGPVLTVERAERFQRVPAQNENAAREAPLDTVFLALYEGTTLEAAEEVGFR